MHIMDLHSIKICRYFKKQIYGKYFSSDKWIPGKLVNDLLIMWGNVTIRKFSINTKEKLFGAKICDLYTLPEPACLHSVTAWYPFKWCHAIIYPEKHLPLYCCHPQIIAAYTLVAAHVHSFGIRQLAGLESKKNSPERTRGLGIA